MSGTLPRWQGSSRREASILAEESISPRSSQARRSSMASWASMAVCNHQRAFSGEARKRSSFSSLEVGCVWPSERWPRLPAVGRGFGRASSPRPRRTLPVHRRGPHALPPGLEPVPYGLLDDRSEVLRFLQLALDVGALLRTFLAGLPIQAQAQRGSIRLAVGKMDDRNREEIVLPAGLHDDAHRRPGRKASIFPCRDKYPVMIIRSSFPNQKIMRQICQYATPIPLPPLACINNAPPTRRDVRLRMAPSEIFSETLSLPVRAYQTHSRIPFPPGGAQKISRGA